MLAIETRSGSPCRLNNVTGSEKEIRLFAVSESTNVSLSFKRHLVTWNSPSFSSREIRCFSLSQISSTSLNHCSLCLGKGASSRGSGENRSRSCGDPGGIVGSYSGTIAKGVCSGCPFFLDFLTHFSKAIPQHPARRIFSLAPPNRSTPPSAFLTLKVTNDIRSSS